MNKARPRVVKGDIAECRPHWRSGGTNQAVLLQRGTVLGEHSELLLREYSCSAWAGIFTCLVCSHILKCILSKVLFKDFFDLFQKQREKKEKEQSIFHLLVLSRGCNGQDEAALKSGAQNFIMWVSHMAAGPQGAGPFSGTLARPEERSSTVSLH